MPENLIVTPAGPEFHKAAKEGNIQVVQNMIEQDADIIDVFDAPNKKWTPLFYATMHGQADIASFLIGKGANIHHTDIDGWTLLHVAARHGHADLVNFFKDHGVDIDATTRSGKTALDWAQQSKHKECVGILKPKAKTGLARLFSKK